jgi:hypothetical protein
MCVAIAAKSCADIGPDSRRFAYCCVAEAVAWKDAAAARRMALACGGVSLLFLQPE